MTWWQQARQSWYRSRLSDPAYGFLFEPPPAEEWVSVDCETTGLDRQRDEIISIGAVKIRRNQILTSERLELVVRPNRAIKSESIRVHQLRQKDVQNGMEPEQAIMRFLQFVGSRPLVGYYLEFDVAMLNRLVKPLLGIPLPQPKFEVSGLYYDWKAPKTQGMQNVDLHFSTIMKELNLPERSAHDAFNDALMAAMMFVKIRHLSMKTL
jgi:DNA polymerase-3 subunit epsilon